MIDRLVLFNGPVYRHIYHLVVMYSHEDVSLALFLAVDGITLNPKNTFEHQPHSIAFW